MRNLGLITTLVALALTACASDTPTPTPASASGAYVVRSGFSVRGDRIGMGAIVRVRGNRPVQKIDLDIAFIAGGRRLTMEPDTLPYCPPLTDCRWGQGFFAGGNIPSPRSIDRIEVTVARDGGIHPGPAEVIELDTDISRNVTVKPRRRDGTAYLVAIRDKVPVFGLSFFTRRDEARPLHYGTKLFPRRDGDEIRAFFYPGPVPASVHGPVD